LPAFELVDVASKSWRLADLRGKKPVINVWATWCGPCREELPYVERLQQRLAGRDDVQLLTLNLDFNPGLVKPYLRRNHFTFPSLFATAWYAKAVEEKSIPRTWVVDGAGVVRFEQLGFSPRAAERWADDALALLDGLAAAPSK
jgi:thiol-disulfide isomerase/thioredoxin